MAVHTCTLKVSGSKVLSNWSKNGHSMKTGDTVKFVSEYGNVKLEFPNDCPFFLDKVSAVVAFFAKHQTPISLKLKRLPRGKRFHFVCVNGDASAWDPKLNPDAGSDIPPSKPPGS